MSSIFAPNGPAYLRHSSRNDTRGTHAPQLALIYIFSFIFMLVFPPLWDGCNMSDRKDGRREFVCVCMRMVAEHCSGKMKKKK